MTVTDLHETFAPLRAEVAGEDDVAAVLASAPSAAPRRRRRRRVRVAVALAGTTAAAAVLLAGLPAERPEPAGEPRAVHASDGASLLRAAAAVAAEQPSQPPFTGYRYTEWLDRWSYDFLPGGPRAYEQRVETWVDKDWHGRRVDHPGRVLAGDPEKVRRLMSEGERSYEYGDGLPRWKLETLPTEPQALREALLEEYRNGVNWAPGRPTADDQHYDLIRTVLILLGDSNVTPELRAAGFEILASTDGVQPAAGARDAEGRAGRAVTIPTRRKDGQITIIFDPETSAMLSWSETGSGGGTPDQTHTIVRSAQVERVGERP